MTRIFRFDQFADAGKMDQVQSVTKFHRLDLSANAGKPIKKPRKPRAPKVQTFLPLEVKQGEGWVSVQLPIRTISQANNFDHWRIKDQRKKTNNNLVKLALNPIASSIKLPCMVTLKR